MIAAILLGCGTGGPSTSPGSEPPTTIRAMPPARVELTLRVESLAGLLRPGELFRRLPDPAGLGVARIIAFEDNPAFLYLCGTSMCDAEAQSPDALPGRLAPEVAHIRRIVLLKPDLVVVDDQVLSRGGARVTWALDSEHPVNVQRGHVSGAVGKKNGFFAGHSFQDETSESRSVVRSRARRPSTDSACSRKRRSNECDCFTWCSLPTTTTRNFQSSSSSTIETRSA